MNEPQFIRSSALHVVEIVEGSHDARCKSAKLGTDVRRTKIDSTEFVHADPQAERNPLSFDHSSTIPDSTPQVLDLLKVSPNPQPNTSDPPALATSAALGAHASESNPRRGQVQSHFSGQINHLKAENNHIRAALERLESKPPNKT